MRDDIHFAIRRTINDHRFHYFKATDSGIKFGILNFLVSCKLQKNLSWLHFVTKCQMVT